MKVDIIKYAYSNYIAVYINDELDDERYHNLFNSNYFLNIIFNKPVLRCWYLKDESYDDIWKSMKKEREERREIGENFFPKKFKHIKKHLKGYKENKPKISRFELMDI